MIFASWMQKMLKVLNPLSDAGAAKLAWAEQDTPTAQ
jgi:hypothetical protein